MLTIQIYKLVCSFTVHTVSSYVSCYNEWKEALVRASDITFFWLNQVSMCLWKYFVYMGTNMGTKNLLRSFLCIFYRQLHGDLQFYFILKCSGTSVELLSPKEKETVKTKSKIIWATTRHVCPAKITPKNKNSYENAQGDLSPERVHISESTLSQVVAFLSIDPCPVVQNIIRLTSSLMTNSM